MFNFWQLLMIAVIWLLGDVVIANQLLLSMLLWIVIIFSIPISMWLYGDTLLIKAKFCQVSMETDGIPECSYGKRLKQYGIALLVLSIALSLIVVILKWYYAEWPVKLQQIISQANLSY